MWRAATAMTALIGAGALLAEETGAFSVEAFQAATPKEISPAFKALMGEAGIRLHRDGKPLVEIWWVKAVTAPVKPVDGSVLMPGVAMGQVWGVVRVLSDWKDIRGQTIKPGVYTLRYGLQPADGDHLGASDYRDYLVLVPAELDTKTDTLAMEPLFNAGRKASRTMHPAVLMLRPHEGKAAKLPAIVKAKVNEEDLWIVNTSVTFQENASAKPAVQNLGIVLIGIAKAG
jgi:hypothetical protein